MARLGSIGTQYFDSAGDPLVDGKLYFYDPGTTTEKTTYADSALTIANSHPVLLDGDGRQPNIFFEGTARAILTNSDDVQLDFKDPVGDTATGYGSTWDATNPYSVGDVVYAPDGNYYQSLTSGNLGNTPSTSPLQWKLSSPQTAADLAFVPTGTIAADETQAAIEEVATDAAAALSAVESAKQDTLVSGTNIKTINSASLLGSGDIEIPIGLQAGATAFSAVSSVEISTPSTYKYYILIFKDLVASVAGTTPTFEVDIAGVLQSTGYYGTSKSLAATTFTSVSSSNDTDFQSATTLNNTEGSAIVMRIHAKGSNPGWNLEAVSTNNPSNMFLDSVYVQVAGDITSITVTPTLGGTITGTYTLYGLSE